MPIDDCPSTECLKALLSGSLTEAEQAKLAQHLETCPGCGQRLEELAGPASPAVKELKTEEPHQRAVQQIVSLLKLSADKPIPPAADLLPGMGGELKRLGDYEVLGELGRGGMGIVLKAFDSVLNRVVAIKVLFPALAASSTARARFLREARAAAAVVHEHVMTIHAVDECNGLPYLVMQLVRGRSLEDRIAAAPLKLEQILRIGHQIAAGLAAAHAQGLIHRDIKPANILLENSVERVKITDFGLARAVDQAPLTQTGCITGTPEYMAPEQARGEAVDHRADLFSLGCVLYAMGAGHSPFRSSSTVAVIRKVCDETPPPVHEVNTDIPRWLSDIVARLMSKAPAERFPSADEVATLLEHWLARVQHGEPAEWRRPRKWPRYAMAGASLFATASLGLYLTEQFRITSFFRREQAPTISKATGEREPTPSLLVFAPSGRDQPGARTLADLVAASQPNDTIELAANGPWPTERIVISHPLVAPRIAGQGSIWVLGGRQDHTTTDPYDRAGDGFIRIDTLDRSGLNFSYDNTSVNPAEHAFAFTIPVNVRVTLHAFAGKDLPPGP